MDDLLIKNALLALNASRKAINRYMKYAEPNDLHTFRQEMKKLHAVRVFMVNTSKGIKIWRYWPCLKEFYRLTSPLRERDIQNEWLQSEGLLTTLEQSQPTISHELIQAYEDWEKYSKKSKRRLKKSTASTKRKTLLNFVDNCRQKASLLLMIEPPGKEWHEARKWIKFSIFLEKIAMRISKDTPNSNKQSQWVNIAGLLGDWHDNHDLWNYMVRINPLNVKEKLEKLTENRISLELEIKANLALV
jgi:hypothetical protein